jgi:hypothetical protein
VRTRLPVHSGLASQKQNPRHHGLAAHPSAPLRPVPQPCPVLIRIVPFLPWATPHGRPHAPSQRADGAGRLRPSKQRRWSSSNRATAHGREPGPRVSVGVGESQEGRAAAAPASSMCCRASSSATTSVHSSKQQGDIVLKVHVASVCFKCFRSVISMLQVFHHGVAYVTIISEVCCTRLFPMFHAYVVNVLSLCLCMFCYGFQVFSDVF